MVARRDGDRWFLGGSFSGPARTVRLPLDLGPGRWLVEIERDGADGLVSERHVVRGGDELVLAIVDEGG
jgi:alpha-glucosidase